MQREKIAVAMSGGVDSGAAAYLLASEDFDVCGVTFDMAHADVPDTGDGSAAAGAAAICGALGVSHASLACGDMFCRYVREPFAQTYMNGQTPNPCVMCNIHVKFPCLLDFADSVGARLAATGHYARIGESGGTYYVRRASDTRKDQSYMLWGLDPATLSRVRFPLGELTKPQIREIAASAGLPCASTPDSQDICFIPDGDFRGYLDRALGESPRGSFIDAVGNVLGSHTGQRNFTIGQSRGLGIALGRRMYVLRRDAAKNEVTLGDEAELFRREVRAAGIRLNWDFPAGTRFSVKIRYSQAMYQASVTRTGEDEVTAVFDEPVRAPAPGQSMVLYDGDTLVGGGIIA